MRSQFSRTVSQCFGILRQLCTIRRSVSQSVFQSFVAALVLTKLDFGNTTLAVVSTELPLGPTCLPVPDLSSRQVAMITLPRSSAAYIGFMCSIRYPSSSLVAIMVYQCIRGLGLAYLPDALQPITGIPGRECLQSSSTSVLDVLPTQLSTVGDRVFPVAAA